jgi:murein DD-endopeptidase MepM/ murein hydrolase activator NlpD
MTRLRRSSSPRRTIFILFLLLLAGSAVAAYLLFFESTKPDVEFTGPTTYLGKQGAVSFHARDGESGLRQIIVTLSQGDLEKEIYRLEVARNGFIGTVGLPDKHHTVEISPPDLGFDDGDARLRIITRDFSLGNFLRGNETNLDKEITIDTKPPRITMLHSERYINPGGSGIVMYRVDEEVEGGAVINDHFNPGFLVDETLDDVYIAYFALPFDASEISSAVVEVSDKAGNIASHSFQPIYRAQKYKEDRINVGDGFLSAKMPEFTQYYPDMQGSAVDKYLFANNEIRRLNNERISELCADPHHHRLWEGRFTRMAGSTKAGFADQRTYYYQGAAIDNQVHLGIDIASTRHAEVKAAATGIAIFADYLGIYGNSVILDHGQGVFSLYSHLSRLNAEVGATFNQGDVLGLTGTSGMAGGDHLHFSMLVNGIFVTPVEWWDQHWIDVTIEEPLTEIRFQ